MAGGTHNGSYMNYRNISICNPIYLKHINFILPEVVALCDILLNILSDLLTKLKNTLLTKKYHKLLYTYVIRSSMYNSDTQYLINQT